MTPEEVLAVPMDPDENDAAASTVREYLAVLLGTLWEEKEGFSGKRPFGNSSWEYELYAALAKAGAVHGRFDEHGYVEEMDDDAANKLISAAVDALCGVNHQHRRS